MNTYRVFISYSHEDYELVDKLVKILEENGLTPMWDKNCPGGHKFPELIKNFIAHSHVFVPVITEASSKRGWVHQEIGYALALNVPILPITLDKVPGEMLHEYQAVAWHDNVEILKHELSLEKFANLVNHSQKNSRPLFECAELHEDRTMIMVGYATKVLELGFHSHVRQIGALSSFHIPDKPLSHPDWQLRYGKFRPSEFRCRWLWEERKVLERHARERGCSLIIDPYITYRKYGRRARTVRLKNLLEFLGSIDDDKVKVGIKKGIPEGHNLTIVGDWFAAESVSAALGKGYRQTIFTRHAPSVHKRIELFDMELENLLQTKGVASGLSRNAAIAEIKNILIEIEKRF
jgi:hypothetical protein